MTEGCEKGGKIVGVISNLLLSEVLKKFIASTSGNV